MFFLYLTCHNTAICKAKYILATTHLKILYQSLIEPYLNYCCIVWANPEKTTILEILHKLQKRATRIILYENYRSHTKPLFNKLNIFNIYDLCRIQILTFVYKSCNHLLPSKYTNYFTRTKEVHQYATRSSIYGNLYVVNAQKCCRVNTLVSRGPKYWNSLPNPLRSASSFGTFKANLKKHLISQYLVT